jgi:hypothetical protein
LHVSALTEGERHFLEELDARGVRYLVVGLAAALLQGANIATQDIDLWFEDLADPRIGDAARAAGGIWVSGSYGMRPPALGGEALGDRFDVVTHVHGLGAFVSEYASSLEVTLAGVKVKILPLARIIASKRALARPRDQAQLPALEEALAALDAGDDPK